MRSWQRRFLPHLSLLLVLWPPWCPAAPPDPVTDDDAAEQDARQLDLYTVTALHKRFAAFCRDADVRVEYEGPLAFPRKPTGIVRREGPASYLTWVVTAPLDDQRPTVWVVLFSITVSLEKQPDTVTSWVINGKELYLQVTPKAKGLTVDTELPQATKKGTTFRAILDRVAERTKR